MAKGATYFNVAMLPLYVGLCTTQAQYEYEMRRLNVKEYDPQFVDEGRGAMTRYYSKPDANPTCLMCIDFKKAMDMLECQVISLIIHESVHIWQEAKAHMGVKLIDREIEAYTIQWISQQFLYHWIEYKKSVQTINTEL